MADESQGTSPENTNDINRLQAENTALHATLREHSEKLAQYADADKKIAEYESKTKNYAEYLRQHVKSSYEAAPEWVREKLTAEEIDGMDPLDGIMSIDRLTAFYAEIVQGVKEKYNIKDSTVDPTRRAPDHGDGAPKKFNSAMDIVAHLTRKNFKE